MSFMALFKFKINYVMKASKTQILLPFTIGKTQTKSKLLICTLQFLY